MLYTVVILSILLAIAIVAIAYLLVTRPSRRSVEKEEERFRMMANSIFAQNSRLMRDDNEKRLAELLDPIKENFSEFRKAFSESYSREARERYSLQERIRELIQLNDTIGRETRQLTSALKGNARVQGDWGEMILQNILSRSGLRQGEEYELQSSSANERGERLRPDAVLSFPDGRKVVIDSKVSIKAYIDMADAADEPQRQALAKAHAASVKSHINELRDKNYQDYVGQKRADFVMMFIPNEGAYLAAMQADGDLWQYAYDNRVVIVSPAHLMAVVKIIEQTWQSEKQSRNAIEIAVEGGRLIDKLCTFLADMDRVNSAIKTAQRAYDSAMAKLNGRGGIISRAEKLQELGAKASRKLPAADPGAWPENLEEK